VHVPSQAGLPASLARRPYPKLKSLLTSNTMSVAMYDVAINGIGNSFPIRWRKWVFYFLVWLQRHHPIAPRLTLVPKKEMLAPVRTADVVS
jgi:hypothetical protein